MLYSWLFALSFLVNTIYCVIVKHTDTGVIEEVDPNSNDDTTNQQNLLRRRLMGGSFSQSDKVSILGAHNQCRNNTAQGLTYGQPSAANMNQLFWDEGLARLAQNYSSKCIWAHNENRDQDLLNYLNYTSFDYTIQAVGENLFLSTGSETLSVILQGIQYWYDEYTYFTFGTTSGTAVCESGQQCGHYTQLVWGQTRYVGCGYTKCSMGVFFVCNYYFPGNVVGYYPYTSGTSASFCSSDRVASSHLCSYCPSRYWDTYCCEYCSASSCAEAKNNGIIYSPSLCTDGLSKSFVEPPTTTTTTQSPTASPVTTLSPTQQPSSKPTTSSPTAKPTPKPTSKPTTPSPTNKPTPKPTSKPTTSSTHCCTAINPEYSNFCLSISTQTTCTTYSSLCTWGC